MTGRYTVMALTMLMAGILAGVVACDAPSSIFQYTLTPLLLTAGILIGGELKPIMSKLKSTTMSGVLLAAATILGGGVSGLIVSSLVGVDYRIGVSIGAGKNLNIANHNIL